MATMQGVGYDGEEGDQRYMAPEYLQYTEHRPSADIFSMALTLYETCLVPCLNTLPSEGEKWQDLRTGKTLALPDRPDTINDMILKCMTPEPMNRPSAQELLGKKEIIEVSSALNTTLLSAKVRQPIGKKITRSRSFRPIEAESSMSSVHSMNTSIASSINRSSSMEFMRNKTPTNMEGVFSYDFVESNFSTSFNETDHKFNQEADDEIESPVMGPLDGDSGFRDSMVGVVASSDQLREDQVRLKSCPSKTKKAIDFSSPQGVNNDWSTEMSTEIQSDRCHDF